MKLITTLKHTFKINIRNVLLFASFKITRSIKEMYILKVTEIKYSNSMER